MILRIILLSAILTLIGSCKNKVDNLPTVEAVITSNHPIFVDRIEAAHKKATFLDNETVCFNLEVNFGGNPSRYKIFSTPNSSNIKVEKADGITTIVSDGVIYTNADTSNWESEKFGIYTWQYFFMAPYKLSDEGTKWKKLPMTTLEETATNTAFLTFEDGTGDAPDDWYMVHSDPQTGLITYLGYIATGGTSTAAEAEKNAHAIKYMNYTDVDGVPISHSWEFYNYSRTEGLGELIGNGTIKNAMFMEYIDNTYDTNGLVKIE